jgi:hypothetical protein
MVDFTLTTAPSSRKSGSRRGLEGGGNSRRIVGCLERRRGKQPTNAVATVICGQPTKLEFVINLKAAKALGPLPGVKRIVRPIRREVCRPIQARARPARPEDEPACGSPFSLLLGGHWSGGASTMQRRRLSLIHVLMRWIRSPTISIWSTASSVITTCANWIFDHDH